MCAAKAEAAATEPRRSARDRIFETAKDLFYRYGIRAVGVEGIASEADATKMTLYRNFSSKDELVAECLRDHKREFWEWWDSVIARDAGDPEAQLQALMKAFITHECGDRSRGCPLANAVVELPEKSHPGRAVIVEHKALIRERLRELCRDMKARDPDTLADALHLLIEGAYISQLTFDCKDDPADSLPRIAKVLIEAHLKK